MHHHNIRKVVGWEGFEPTTNGLKGHCSTVELPTQKGTPLKKERRYHRIPDTGVKQGLTKKYPPVCTSGIPALFSILVVSLLQIGLGLIPYRKTILYPEFST